jgi:hypothetical protein
VISKLRHDARANDIESRERGGTVMHRSAVAVATIALAVTFTAACTDSPTSPQGALASWTLTLDEAVTITSIRVTCHPDARLHICRATAEIQNGPPRDITRTTAVWTSSHITVATVSPFGIVTPVGLGETTITAAAGGFTGSTLVVVTD